MDYVEDAYQMTLLEPDWSIWSPLYVVSMRSDVHIEVDAIQQDEAGDTQFGVMCRLRGLDTFYAFLVASDGYTKIMRVKGDEYELLAEQEQPIRDVTLRVNQLVRIRAECSQTTLRLFTNGRLRLEVQDDAIKYGSVGLIVEGVEPGTSVLFDNFLLTKP